MTQEKTEQIAKQAFYEALEEDPKRLEGFLLLNKQFHVKTQLFEEYTFIRKYCSCEKYSFHHEILLIEKNGQEFKIHGNDMIDLQIKAMKDKKIKAFNISVFHPFNDPGYVFKMLGLK